MIGRKSSNSWRCGKHRRHEEVKRNCQHFKEFTDSESMVFSCTIRPATQPELDYKIHLGFLAFLSIELHPPVPRQFVYGHFVYDTSSTDISSTDVSSTTVYQRTGQLYIQLLFQQIIIFITSNFHLYYDSFYQSHFHWHYDNITYIVCRHCGMTIQLVLSVKDAYFYQSHLKLGRIPCINPGSIDIVFVSSLQLLFQQGKS